MHGTVVRRESGAWKGRRGAAALLRGLVWALPVTTSVLATWLVSRSAAAGGRGVFERAGLWLLLSVVATVVLLAVDRFARRLLPLAALLKLSLVFPDQAPSRFRTAPAHRHRAPARATGWSTSSSTGSTPTRCGPPSSCSS